MLKHYLYLLVFLVGSKAVFAQTSTSNKLRPIDLVPYAEDSIKRQFAAQKLNWPPASLLIRSFKYDQQLEVWVKNESNAPYKLFKTYKVCMQSGTTGPKRMEGDYQVPEGLYYINDFNPNSNYHLSLGLSYPNASDRVLSDSVRPGSAIYIHGSCVSVGCIAVHNYDIEELFALTTAVKNTGQDFIPVHVFPARYNKKESLEYLVNAIKDKPELIQFNKNLRPVYDYFEMKKELPIILVNRKGEYVIN
jgi:murein L,D-transpeptidase YafK